MSSLHRSGYVHKFRLEAADGAAVRIAEPAKPSPSAAWLLAKFIVVLTVLCTTVAIGADALKG